jgi:hypothetical protein
VLGFARLSCVLVWLFAIDLEADEAETLSAVTMQATCRYRQRSRAAVAAKNISASAIKAFGLSFHRLETKSLFGMADWQDE